MSPITKICCDNQLRRLTGPLTNKFKVAVNYANPQEQSNQGTWHAR